MKYKIKEIYECDLKKINGKIVHVLKSEIVRKYLAYSEGVVPVPMYINVWKLTCLVEVEE